MKPEVGGEGSMAQEEFDPLDLMSRVAMLVLEARTPHRSAKGRVEGPHCPSSEQQGQHRCSQEMLECLRASEFTQRIDLMWRNGIPSCIDILLFPDCVHGIKEAQSLEGAGSGVQENSLLLERWNIQCIKKWHGEWTDGVAGSMLLQAVRSYLYFSQLSSWLASTHGCLPSCIAYRLYAPGEQADVDFAQPPQSHIFPSGVYGRHGLKVTVLFLPRQQSFPALPCALACQVPQGAGVGAWGQGGGASLRGAQPEESAGDAGRWKRQGARSKLSGCHQAKAAEAFCRLPTGAESLAADSPSKASHTQSPTSLKACRAQSPSSFKVYHTQSQDTEYGESLYQTKSRSDLRDVSRSNVQGRCQGGEQGVKCKRSAVRDALESQLRPLELTSPSGAQRYDLHSPKVLMSDTFHNPIPVTRRKQLDFSHPERLVPSGLAPMLQPPEEKASAVKHSHLPSPLSPLDMQAFLANLQSISAPIPSRPHQQQALTCQLKAQAAARLRQVGGGEEGYCQSLTRGLSESQEASQQPCARFRKKKALPFGGDPPLPESAESEMVSAASEAARRPEVPDSSYFLKNLPFFPAGKSLDAAPCHSDLWSWREETAVEARKKEESEKAKAITETQAYSSKQDAFDLSEERRLSYPANKAGNASFPVMIQHSISHTLSESINQTLRDLNKIVRASETKVSHCSGEHRFAEVFPESSSSSSSSSSSTYSSSPRFAAEDGGRHSDSSTPTNLSSSPLPEDAQAPSCHGNRWQNGTSVPGLPQASPACHRQLASDEASPLSSTPAPATHVHALTPETGDKVFADTVVKRRLELEHLQPCSQTADASERKVEMRAAESTGWCLPKAPVTEAINLNVPPVQRPTLQQFVEHDNCLYLPTPEQFHSDVARDKAPHPLESGPKSKAGGRAENDELKSSCSFYLESPSTAEPVGNGAVDSDSVSGAQKEETGLVSSLRKLDLHGVEREGLSSHTNGWLAQDPSPSQPQSNGCLVKDISQSHGSEGGVSQGQESQSSCNSCFDSSAPSDISVQCEGDSCSDSSIKRSPLAESCPKNVENRGQHVANGSVGTCTQTLSCHEGKTSGQPFSNKAQHDAKPIPHEEDNVFYDKADGIQSGDLSYCPVRTKSAPSFSSLSAKCKVGNEENFSSDEVTRGRSLIRDKDSLRVSGQERLRHRLVKSASVLFNSRGGLPSQSSPAPVKRRATGCFDYDETLSTTKAIKSAISMSRLPDVYKDSSQPLSESGRILSTSAPASTNCLLGNFEESILNGRLEPAGVVEGFSVDIGASGSFCPRHLSLPVTAYFFNLSDDNAPSPYLGHINLEEVGKRGYHIPHKGTLQVTLFNPNKTVVKMFVVMYDLEDMPPNSQTVIRQRTVYVPVDPNSDLPCYLRYLIHLRVSSGSSSKIYLHTDVRLIFARNKFELDSSVAQYELRSFTETPENPKYSPKR